MTPVSAFPLTWPAHWPRIPAPIRKRGKFSTMVRPVSGGYADKERLTIADGVNRVLVQVQRLGVDADAEIIISTNAASRRDGLPRSSDGEPLDPGCAVYWSRGGERECMAIDLYDRLADNLAAVAATIESMRGIERHGGAQILGRAFQGFKLLPATTSATMGVEAAWETLAQAATGASAPPERHRNEDYARSLCRIARGRTHPDTGGEPGRFDLVQTAAATLSTHYGLKL